MENTTIQISNKLKETLGSKKLYNKESYEEIIWDLIEDSMELSEETKKDIEKARKQVKQGKFKTFSKIKKELGL
jgi:hypothetical protein